MNGVEAVRVFAEGIKKWWPHRDSNPGFHLERVAS